MYDNDFASWLLYMSDVRRCRALLARGSRSFHAASLILPQRYRLPIVALYAFCRVADDEIDARDSGEAALESLYDRLDRIYAGQPSNHAVDRAFADVVRIYEIPQAIPAALLEGFSWDIHHREYETLSDVVAYSARVAGTVGTMIAMILGVRQADILSRACDLGVAMQLTNIARDVGEDAAAGRLYLPRRLLAQSDIEPDEWLRNPVLSDALRQVIGSLLDEADRLYARSEWGLTKLPASSRPAMFAARHIYAEIGHELRRRGCDSVTQRTIVGGRRKIALLARSLSDAIAASRREDDAPPLTEVRFLLEAVSPV